MNFTMFLCMNLMQATLISTGCKVAAECPVVGVPLMILGGLGMVANVVLFLAPGSE